jgi:uncharacterized membrane protein HdeD (DUF308 family)
VAAAIAFGVLTWMRPGISLASLVLLFGIYAVVDGVMGVWVAVAARKKWTTGGPCCSGDWSASPSAALTFLTPGITALAFLFYIAVWAIARGVLEIVSAIRLRKEIQGNGCSSWPAPRRWRSAGYSSPAPATERSRCCG